MENIIEKMKEKFNIIAPGVLIGFSIWMMFIMPQFEKMAREERNRPENIRIEQCKKILWNEWHQLYVPVEFDILRLKNKPDEEGNVNLYVQYQYKIDKNSVEKGYEEVLGKCQWRKTEDEGEEKVYVKDNMTLKMKNVKEDIWEINIVMK